MRKLFVFACLSAAWCGTVVGAERLDDFDLSALPHVHVPGMIAALAAEKGVREAAGDGDALSLAVVDALQRAYRRAGWITAKATIEEHDQVQVVAGERLRCGPIHLSGSVVDGERLQWLLSGSADEEESALQPGWISGAWSPADSGWLHAVEQVVYAHYERHGFFEVEVDIAVSALGDGLAQLHLGMSTGPEEHIAGVVVNGRHGHGEDKLLHWLQDQAGVQVGALATSDRLQKVREALLESGRFLSADARYHPNAQGNGLDVVLEVSDWAGLPRIDQPDPPLLLSARRLRSWLKRVADNDAQALYVRFADQSPGLDLEAVIRLGKSLKVQFSEPFKAGVFLDTAGVGIYDPAADQWLQALTDQPLNLMWTALLSNVPPEPGETDPSNTFTFNVQFSTMGRNGLMVQLPPSALLVAFSRLEGEPLFTDDGSVSWSEPWGSLKIGADGEPTMTLVNADDPAVPWLTVRAVDWDSPAAMEALGAERLAQSLTASWKTLPVAMKTSSPLLVWLDALLRDGARSEDWAVALGAIWDWLAAENDDGLVLSIPLRPQDTSTSGMEAMLEFAAGFAATHWQPEQWPRRLTEGVIAVISNDGATINRQVNALISDSSMGPLGCLAVAYALDLVQQTALSRQFRDRARDVIELRAVVTDLQVLVGGKDVLEQLIQSLDWQRVQRLLPPAQRLAEVDGLTNAEQRLAHLWDGGLRWMIERLVNRGDPLPLD